MRAVLAAAQTWVALAAFAVDAPQSWSERVEVVVEQVPARQLAAHRGDVREHLVDVGGWPLRGARAPDDASRSRSLRGRRPTESPREGSSAAVSARSARAASPGAPPRRARPPGVGRRRARGVHALELRLAQLVAQQARERAHALDRLARLVHELGGIRRCDLRSSSIGSLPIAKCTSAHWRL